MSNNSRPRVSFAFFLAMTMALGPLALDTYLPAFPAMAESLQTSIHAVALSVPVYVFVLALGQLVAGPLSDRYGRAVVMFAGLGVFSLASFALSFASNLTALLVLRGIQAFGAGWAVVCVPAMVRDRLAGREAARFFSLIGLIMIAAPAIAPSIGNILLQYWGWVSIFVFLGVYSAVQIVLLKLFVFTPKHTVSRADSAKSKDSRKPFSVDEDIPPTVLSRYRSVLSTEGARRYIVLQTLAFAIMLLFITHSAFLYQQHFGVGPTAFSLLFGANIVLMLLVNLVNRALLNRFLPHQILRWSLSAQGVAIASLVCVSLFTTSIWWFFPFVVLTVGLMGAISPNIQASFMEYFPNNGGTAAAMLGATQFFMGGLIAGGSSLLPESVLSVVLVQALCSLLCVLVVWYTYSASASAST